MYSQCPNCKAIFNVSEADIGAHHGLVRCGYCGGVFNALTYGVDDARVKSDEPPGAADGAASAAGERAEAGGAASSDTVDEQDTAVAQSKVYQDRADPYADRAQEVHEDREWEVPARVEDENAPDYYDEPLIEPVLPGARAIAAQPPVKSSEETSEETSREQAAREEAAREEAAREEAAREEAAREEAVREEAVREEAVREEAVREEAAREEAARGGADRGEADRGEADRGEADRDEASPEAPPVAEAPDLPGEIIEEITIEAPPVLWNAFDEDTEEQTGRRQSAGVDDDGSPAKGSSRSAATGFREPALGAQRSRSGRDASDSDTEPVSGSAGTRPGRRAPLRSPYGGRDIAVVELPQPRPFKTATLSLLTVLLALLLVWQAKTFYLAELAQVPVLRPYLERLCRPLGCVLPPRQDFARIDLVGTSIDVNPEFPGALDIKASLVNRAQFPQPYPPLRVTLTDREGRVVGRRTYLPSEYREGDGRPLPSGDVRNVSINLAQPAETAVGYEVELMAPVVNGEG